MCQSQYIWCLTQQFTRNWSQFKALRQSYAGTRFEEQRLLYLPQKHKITRVTDQNSTLREMNRLEEHADNAKARDLYWKPLSSPQKHPTPISSTPHLPPLLLPESSEHSHPGIES
jgi:hypothetical protein